MDFNLTEDQKLIRDMVREFAEKELADLAAEFDEKREFPKGILKKMGELGLLGLAIPEKFDGSEMDLLSIILATEEIAKTCASTAVIFAIHNLVLSSAIAKFATDEQKKYLSKLATGKMLAGFGLMEPDSADSISDLNLIASKNGDEFILSGTKRMILGGDEADLFIVFARDEMNNILIFVIEKGGFSLDSDDDTLGLHAAKCMTAKFDDCKISIENLLGNPTGQADYFKEIQEIGKLAISAVGLGIAQTALKLSIEHSGQRKQFGQFIGEFEGLQWMMAQMHTGIASMRNNLYHAVALKDEGKPAEKECAVAKLTSAQITVKATIDAIQIRGGYGYMREYPLERMFRDAKATEFILGTMQTQKKIIAKKIQGK